jgi:hypothetical protein
VSLVCLDWTSGDWWDWEVLRGPDTYAVQINDVSSFLDKMPLEFMPATNARPLGGLPKNVWVGGLSSKVWPEILQVRSAVRFLILDSEEDVVSEIVGAWRCSNCGTRGYLPRPNRCPNARGLCGDAKLLPEIHKLITTHNFPDATKRGIEILEELHG